MESKLDYYARNRQARKEYQREYYIRNKNRIKRKRKLEELNDPEKFIDRKNYNRSYYQKNRARILKRRANAYAQKKKEQKAVTANPF
jgi:hypothetical protein|tara:strand:+ start:674 stop:934 length:261 start_codon:yes stop_codon:yes gene_type:complete